MGRQPRGNYADPAARAIVVPGRGVDNGPTSRQHEFMKPMSMRRFRQIVAHVMQHLPARWQPYLDNVVVDVEEEPTRDFLLDAGLTEDEIDAGESVYGYFAPLDLTSPWGGDVIDVRDLPHRIFIFKRPLEEDFPDRRQLMTEIKKTVIHELAHHFGFTDRDLEAFDDDPDPFGKGSAE
jgi:predicted Zn-dependent protease with MMP-like domain